MVTAAGEISLARIYFCCVQCREGGYAADDRLGINGRFSTGAERLACLAAASWSFDISSQRLEEFCGIRIADNTIRDVAQRHGAAMNAWQNSRPEACREFREAEGNPEFTTDGTSVNTTDGWREMKLGIFVKRAAGAPTPPDEWANRTLPAPTARIAFCAIERSDRFGRRWKQWARRLGIPDTSIITVLADGAKWIWEEQLNHLRGADGVLDVFHAIEHLADAARILFGEGTEAASQWLDESRRILLNDGWPGISVHLRATRKAIRSKKKREKITGLLAYLSSHSNHLDYCSRLANGRSIGSGQVEGACRHLIGRRLKQCGARWRFRRVNRMAGLCSAMYSNNWEHYWNSLAT